MPETANGQTSRRLAAFFFTGMSTVPWRRCLTSLGAHSAGPDIANDKAI